MSPTRQRVLGLDFGGVLRQSVDHEKDEVEIDGWGFLKIQPVAGSLEGSRLLNREVFERRVWIISKCQPRVAKLSRTWLKHYHFFERSGILSDHFCHCSEREQKATLCKEHNITDFVDNRLEVLLYMVGRVPRLYLFSPSEQEVRPYKEFLPHVQVAKNWQKLVCLIRSAPPP